jgi:hypothetical protein
VQIALGGVCAPGVHILAHCSSWGGGLTPPRAGGSSWGGSVPKSANNCLMNRAVNHPRSAQKRPLKAVEVPALESLDPPPAGGRWGGGGGANMCRHTPTSNLGVSAVALSNLYAMRHWGRPKMHMYAAFRESSRGRTDERREVRGFGFAAARMFIQPAVCLYGLEIARTLAPCDPI